MRASYIANTPGRNRVLPDQRMQVECPVRQMASLVKTGLGGLVCIPIYGRPQGKTAMLSKKCCRY